MACNHEWTKVFRLANRNLLDPEIELNVTGLFFVPTVIYTEEDGQTKSWGIFVCKNCGLLKCKRKKSLGEVKLRKKKK